MDDLIDRLADVLHARKLLDCAQGEQERIERNRQYDDELRSFEYALESVIESTIERKYYLDDHRKDIW